MAERYLINGVQIGMLISYIDNGESKEALGLLQNIINHQFIWKSKDDMVSDVRTLRVATKRWD